MELLRFVAVGRLPGALPSTLYVRPLPDGGCL